MSNQTDRPVGVVNQTVRTSSASSIGSISVTNRSFLKRARSVMQLFVFVMLIVMFLMNLFRGTPNDQHTTQTLYKMLEMPEMAALSAPGYTNFLTNGTAN